MITVHFKVSEGTPSSHYSREEQASNGALDYDVTLTVRGETLHTGESMIKGVITLFRDHNGCMGPCGAPLDDDWCSREILSAVDELGGTASKEIIANLTVGRGADGDTLEIDTPDMPDQADEAEATIVNRIEEP